MPLVKYQQLGPYLLYNLKEQTKDIINLSAHGKHMPKDFSIKRPYVLLVQNEVKSDEETKKKRKKKKDSSNMEKHGLRTTRGRSKRGNNKDDVTFFT